jgi:hypothetical protein
MNCLKCSGMMNFETFVSCAAEGGPWTYEGWRCVYCGDIVDPVILRHRIRTRTQELVSIGKDRLRR